MIWAKCPKEIFVNKRRVKRAVTEAVCEYNKGTVRTIVETQKALGVATGGSTKQLATILDCRKQKFRKRRQMPLIRHLMLSEAYGPTNLEQSTLNHVQSDTMASAVLANPTRDLQGTNRGSGPATEGSENDVESLEQLLLYADEHYFAGKLPLGDHLGKVLHGVDEYHQRRLHTRTRLSSVPKTNRDSSLNTTFCQSVKFHIDLSWHHCRRSCRCSGVKGSARKGRLDLRFASARCLKIVCGTSATPTSAHIVERVIVGSTSSCRTIIRSSLLVVFLLGSRPGFPRVSTFSFLLFPTISKCTLRTIHLASNTVRRPASSFHPDDQASLNFA
ncbi:uncharacterized protein TNCV_1859811 [Trichonephila clavipes]|nr:uncharacterized protein TNCV_1859811 [Trichonephila clavipes]